MVEWFEKIAIGSLPDRAAQKFKDREALYFNGERNDSPPFPENYLSSQAQAILDEYHSLLESARSAGQPLPEFPESALIEHVDNTWHDSAEAIINNWIGQVYQLTNVQRDKPFKEVIDPTNPLGL